MGYLNTHVAQSSLKIVTTHNKYNEINHCNTPQVINMNSLCQDTRQCIKRKTEWRRNIYRNIPCRVILIPS